MIKTSIQKAERGVSIGEDMRTSLNDMVLSINNIVSEIKEIADASMHEVETI
jgi:methyl-accepting chemotaxis protein